MIEGEVFLEDKHHTFFPDITHRIEEDLEETFGDEFHVIISPRAHQHHNPLSEFITGSFGPAAMYIHDTRTIYLLPELSVAIDSVVPEMSEAELEEFLQIVETGVHQFLDNYSQQFAKSEAVKDAKELADNIIHYRANGQKDYLEDEVLLVLGGINFFKGDSSATTVFSMMVLMPLISRFPALKDKLETLMESNAFHEAGHQWVDDQVSDFIFTGDEVDKLEEILNDHIDWTKVRKRGDYFFSIRKEPELHRLELTWLVTVDDLRELVKDFPDEIREKIFFYYLWNGLSEDAARALSIWKTGDVGQRYSEQEIRYYFGLAGSLPYYANAGIDSFLAILADSGLSGFQEHLAEEKERFLDLAKDLSNLE